MEKFDYETLQAEMRLKYGVNLDETSLSILHVLRTEQNEGSAYHAKQIEQAAQKINTSTHSLHIDSKRPGWQAFWFGMGKFGFSAVFFISVLSVWGIVYGAKQQDNEQMQKEWYWYKAYYDSSHTNSLKKTKILIRHHLKPKD